MINGNTVKELLNFEGNVRGASITSQVDYIKKKWGANGFKRIQKKMNDYTRQELDYDNLIGMKWYPAWAQYLLILIIKDEFKLNDKSIIAFGYEMPRFSTIIKLLVMPIINIKMLAKRIPTAWKQQNDYGILETNDFNERKKEGKIIIKGLPLNKTFCKYFEGYMTGVGKFINYKNLKIREVKCLMKENIHEFKVTWD